MFLTLITCYLYCSPETFSNFILVTSLTKQGVNCLSFCPSLLCCYLWQVCGCLDGFTDYKFNLNAMNPYLQQKYKLTDICLLEHSYSDVI